MKTLREDCRFHAGYSLTVGFSWFTDSVMLLDHLHVQNVTTPQLRGMLLWIVMDISALQSQQSSGVIWAVMRKSQRANHTVIEIQNSHTLNYNSNRCIYIPRSWLRKGFASDYHRKHYTQALFFVTSTPNENSHSHARGFSDGTTLVTLDLKGVLPFSVFLTGSIGSVWSSVAKNPHHNTQYHHIFILKTTLISIIY